VIKSTSEEIAMKEYGELMSFMLHHRERFSTEEDFRRFIKDSLGALSRDVRDFGVEISVRPDVLNPRRNSQDWNHLILGCE
jgi:hypothetical protein